MAKNTRRELSLLRNVWTALCANDDSLTPAENARLSTELVFDLGVSIPEALTHLREGFGDDAITKAIADYQADLESKLASVRKAVDPLTGTIACAVASDSLSKQLLKDLAEKNGLEVTQEAVVAFVSDLEKQRESVIPGKLKAIDTCIGFLFSDDTAKELGAWPRPAGYFE